MSSSLPATNCSHTVLGIGLMAFAQVRIRQTEIVVLEANPDDLLRPWQVAGPAWTTPDTLSHDHSRRLADVLIPCLV